MRVIETIGGLYELARLGFLSRFRFSGGYWTWRLHTAFGRGSPPARERNLAILDYGRWIYRMRRGR